MITSFRCAAAFVLIAMLAVTGWASSEVALWKTPRAVATHPWFIATLFDTYFAFLTFYVWLAYKEPRPRPLAPRHPPARQHRDGDLPAP